MSNVLDNINTPQDLRKLPVDKLPEVCSGLRKFIIDTVSRHPGHFASSMGAVEITVALHYVFNTPYDRVVWDVGHQAYPHKILTGRREDFETLRTLGGLSGFPSPAESEYDTFAAGHASNSISAALGMAVASSLKKETPARQVVAVIGDASISGGLAFEGLNNVANSDSNILIILNDNDMSIDPNVGSLNSYLAHINISPTYNKLRYQVYNTLKKLHLVTPKLRGKILRFNNSLKSFFVNQQNIFEGLDIRYFGPFDGHDVQKIVAVLKDIKNIQGPKLLHLRTVKGKGYPAAEKDPTTWHAPGKFDPATAERIKSPSAGKKFQDIFGEQLVKMAADDDRIVGVTAAMPSGTSMSRMMEAFPGRTFDVGIAEGHAVTFAGALAKEGMKPFVAIYSAFLQRAYDHLVHDVALNSLPVVLCIDRAGLVGEDGPTHHGSLDLAYMRSIPGMTVSAPRDGFMLKRLLETARTFNDGPFSIRYPRGADLSGADTDQSTVKAVEIGKGEKLVSSQSPQVAILTIGTVAVDALKAVERLKNEGIEAALYDMVFLKPLDRTILAEVASAGCPVVTAEDGTIEGGLGSAVAEWFAANSPGQKVTRLGIPDKFVQHGTVSQLKEICGIDADGIYNSIKSTLQ